MTRRHPHLYECHAAVYLNRLRSLYNSRLNLGNIPDKELEKFVSMGMDWVWMMGVWKRSPGSRKGSWGDPHLHREYQWANANYTEDDILGSPYSIYGYDVDPHLGSWNDLAKLRKRLNALGIRLMLDFVPNHLSYDHPWTVRHPEYFIRGKESDYKADPVTFYPARKGLYLAHGKDPYFPAWLDTVQLNLLSPKTRDRLGRELSKIAAVSDGVRCDMAMLALNRVFKGTWEKYLPNGMPKKEFWTEMIHTVRASYPDFVFLAEAYWNLEQELQNLGFDFTYDKVLYDRLRHTTPSDIRLHLQAGDLFQSRSARFIENHDEQRSFSSFSEARIKAAALAFATLPGMRFFHDGQLEGFERKIPVQMGKCPPETGHPDLRSYYDGLLALTRRDIFHDGTWVLLSAYTESLPKPSAVDFLTWAWEYRGKAVIVIINYSAAPSWTRVWLPAAWCQGERVEFFDHGTQERYDRKGRELRELGLFVQLEAWKAHVFEIPIP